MLARILPSLAALLGIALPAPAADVPRYNLVAIVTDDQAQWARELDYHDQPLEAALAVVDAVRAHTVPLLRRISEHDWKREGRHTEMGHYTAESWLNVYSEHLEKHAGQIERNLAQWRAQSR